MGVYIVPFTVIMKLQCSSNSGFASLWIWFYRDNACMAKQRFCSC